jgi:hypothetical protein
MVEHRFDGAVGVPKVLFIEFFDVLFFNAVYDALYPGVDDRLL